METDNTKEWEDYQKGLAYKRKINLQQEVDINERFYAGKQWEGVKSNGLSTPVFNLIKRGIQFKVSSVMSNSLKINYSIDGIDDVSDNPEIQELREIADTLSKFSVTMWERLKMDESNEKILKDGALTGDGITYFYFDTSINTGEEVKGDIAKEEIDNVNYFPGNPNDSRVQTQPYIIIAYRKLVDDLKKEAKMNGISPSEIEKITPDTETQNQSGDRSKIELDDSGKTICLLKMWKNPETGNVWFKKSTRNATIKKDTNTNLRRYPVALMNWEERKNSCHGVSEATAIIDNQMFINKAYAASMMSAMLTAFPKLMIDTTRIHEKVTNTVGGILNVAGDTHGAAGYLTPGQASFDIYKMIEMSKNDTKDMMGVNDTQLGNIDPKNTSAIIAILQTSGIPLESIKRRFYNYIEDIALIWIDFWVTKYNVTRNLTIKKNNKVVNIPFDGTKYQDKAFRVKIDIGPSSQWSEITAMQTLDNLLLQKHITIEEYLERLPNGIIPQKQELLESREKNNLDKQLASKYIQELMQRVPPEMQQMLATMPPDEAELYMKQAALSMEGGMMTNGVNQNQMPNQNF